MRRLSCFLLGLLCASLACDWSGTIPATPSLTASVDSPAITSSPGGIAVTPSLTPFHPDVTLAASPTDTAVPTDLPTDTPIPTETPKPTATPGSPGTFDDGKLGTIERNVTYCSAAGSALKMDVYYPDTQDGLWPGLVFVHGGGWTSGDKSDFEGLQWISSLGYLVVSVNYRLAPKYKFPAMIEDVKCSVRYLRAHAAEYNLDPERIGASGNSAGGHLAALLATTDASAGWETGEYLDQSSRVRAVIVEAAPSDLTQPIPDELVALIKEIFGNGQFPTIAELAAASPVTYITSDDPPFLILHGNRDDIVPIEQGFILYNQLLAAGVPAELVVVQNGGHGLNPVGGPIRPTLEKIFQMTIDFFDSYLK